MKNPFADDYGVNGFGFFSICTVIFVIIVSLGMSLAYYSAGQEAIIFNKLHGTTWTAGDFFWAGNQINSSVHTIHLDK
jgi:hypothetical protein